MTIAAGTTVYVAADEGGVAGALTTALEARGAHLAEDPATADGVVWLPALDEEPPLGELTPQQWHDGLASRVKRLAATMRDLPASTFLIAATRLDGRHGADAAGATSVMGGAVTGFTKALARERADAVIKAVDFEPDAAPAAIADALLGELERDPGVVEVGHAIGLRWELGLVERPAEPAPDAAHALRPTDTFVVTGAAGSIVSAIAADLATAARGGTFHLLDLTPEPAPDDPDVARFATDHEGLKRDVIDRVRASGDKPTPKRVEHDLAAIERARAARDAIEAIERAGGRAVWHAVDLTDAAQVAEALTGVERVDVLVHAAGLEISHVLPDKPQRGVRPRLRRQGRRVVPPASWPLREPRSARRSSSAASPGASATRARPITRPPTTCCASRSPGCAARARRAASRSTGPPGPASAWPAADRFRRSWRPPASRCCRRRPGCPSSGAS